jgi:hypothetical protein
MHLTIGSFGNLQLPSPISPALSKPVPVLSENVAEELAWTCRRGSVAHRQEVDESPTPAWTAERAPGDSAAGRTDGVRESELGYTRIQGALKNLGHRVARSTVAAILKEEGRILNRLIPLGEWAACSGVSASVVFSTITTARRSARAREMVRRNRRTLRPLFAVFMCRQLPAPSGFTHHPVSEPRCRRSPVRGSGARRARISARDDRGVRRRPRWTTWLPRPGRDRGRP